MKRQTGSALVMVLVVVVVLILGVLAAVRSTESATLIAGNSAFRQATKQASDLGVNAAFGYLDTVSNFEATVANRYYAVRQTEDAYGMPTGITWDSVAEQTVSNYKMQYVVERLCRGALPIADPPNQCVTEVQPASGSNKLGAEAYAAPATTVYRVTVRTRGPKNSESYTQALISR
jgi:type IV pilus assembly protein PilX